MTDKVVLTCASCGARLEEYAEQCHLCGWIVGVQDHDERDEVPSNESMDEVPSNESMDEAATPTESNPNVDTTAVEADAGIYCNQCGWLNPIGANFCSSCGAKLQLVESPTPVKKAELPVDLKKKAQSTKSSETSSDDPDIETQRPQKVGGMQVAMLVTASFLIVAALYMITAFSKRAFPTTETTPQQQAEAATEPAQSAPLSSDVEARIQTLAEEAESLTGEAQIEKKREIVSLLMGGQRFDRAAPVQEEIASTSGLAEDWFQAGHFYYDWMDQLSGPQRPSVAQRAVTAYEQGLTINPDDLIVRTALAMAYLNTSTPMLGISQIRQVLDEDPDHLEGNFYFGIMLMQINRVEQAKERFERVKQLVGPENPMHEQANIMLNNIASLTG